MTWESQTARKRRLANTACTEGCREARQVLTQQCRHDRARAWLQTRGLDVEKEVSR